eukprot:scaffold37499_cov88-Skeletonema_marinoi.AAC.1
MAWAANWALLSPAGKPPIMLEANWPPIMGLLNCPIIIGLAPAMPGIGPNPAMGPSPWVEVPAPGAGEPPSAAAGSSLS